MELDIVYHPNPILRRKSEELSAEQINSSETQTLIKNMVLALEKHQGLGLAAPQIGKNLRIIIVRNEDQNHALINPKIKHKSWGQEIDEEGCLSIPGVYALVKRPKNVIVKAQNDLGEIITIKAQGLHARVLQHEIDHLNGILFIDKSLRITKGKMPSA